MNTLKKILKILMVKDATKDVERIQREVKKNRMNFDARVVSGKTTYEEALVSFCPDIILSDKALANFDSMEALKISRECNLDIPFIFVTEENSKELTEQSLKAGADDYILMSGLSKLPEAIQNAVNRKYMVKNSAEKFERYKAMLEIMPVGCLILDTDLRFVYWNPKAEKVFGFTCDEVKGKLITETIAPSSAKEYVQNIFGNVKRNAGSLDVMENTTRAGKTIICEWRNAVLTGPENEFIGILSTCIDITDKIATGNEMMKFASLVEKSTELIAMGGISGNLTYLNKAGCQMTGLDKNDVKIKRLSDFFLQEDHKRLATEVIPSIVNDGNWKGEFRMIHFESGRIIPVYMIGYLIRNRQQPMPVALALIAHDISGQKEAQDKLLKSEERLQAALTELNTFIYRASHDLKGPLASIAGLLTLAAQEIEDGEALRYISMIKESTTRLGLILTGLIETMRVRESKLQAEKVDLALLVQQNVDQFRFRTDFEKVEIRVNIDVKKPFFSFCAILNSVFQNLIENALKYHNYALDYPIVSVFVTDYKDGIKIEVVDNGHGMSEEVQKRIFEMYYRGHEDSKGTGLGLYIVKTAVERMKGTIQVNSRLGEGSRFTVYLPSQKTLLIPERLI